MGRSGRRTNDLYSTTRKTYAKTARIILEQLSELTDCSHGCYKCEMRYEDGFRRPICLYDEVLNRLLWMEENE